MQPLALVVLLIFEAIIAVNINCVSSFKFHSKSNGPYVQTPLGGIKGYYQTSYRGRKYATFESIPYALPPIGKLRFQPPQPIPAWSNDIEANKLPPKCVQYDLTSYGTIYGQENCLYLNVYVPVNYKNNASLPVLFWIHGGGFQTGTSSRYRAKYLMDRDLILVTTNYRVGVFGFLSTGDEIVPGNMGLKDQNLALRWIHENIKCFGGDRDKITLAGVSAGGASVHYHYLSPMSRGLFRNGISFSGSAFNPWAYANGTAEVTKLLSAALNCSLTISIEMLHCLQRIPAEAINLQVQKFWNKFPFSFFPFPPVSEKIVDNYFIDKSPEEIIRNGEAYDAPWMTGDVPEEGLFMTAGFILKDETVALVDENWSRYAPYALHYKYHKPESTYNEFADITREHYFGDKKFCANKKNVTSLLGDKLIVAGVVRGAKMHADTAKSPVWFYYYTYKAAQSVSNSWSNSTVDLGVSHDDDIYLVLENEYIDPTTTASDRHMLEEMLDFWYSFVSEGKPNLGVQWNPLDSASEDFQYMHIAGPKNYKMEVDNNFREVQFWNSIGL